MINKDNLLDNIFKDALGDFEVTPPASVRKGVFASAIILSKNKLLWFFLLPFILGIAGLFSIVWFAGSGNVTGIANSLLQRDSIHYTHPFQNKNISLLSTQKNDIENIELPDNSSFNKKPISNFEKSNPAENINTKITTNTDANADNFSASIPNKTLKNSNVENRNEETNYKMIASNNAERIFNNNDRSFSPSREIMDKPFTIDKLKSKTLNFLSEVPLNFDYTERNKSKARWLWSANIFAGTNLWQPENLIKNNPDADEVTSGFSTKNYSYHTGLSVMGEKKNFFFEIGMQYNHLVNKNYADRILYNQETHSTIDSAGSFTNYDTTGSYLHYIIVIDSVIRIIDTILEWKIDTSNMTLYDTSFYNTTKELNQSSWKNNFSFIEVPVALGWKKDLGRFSVRIGTGPILSFLIAKKINVPDEITAQQAFQTISQKFSGFKLGVSWQLLAALSYRISERWSVELQPYGRYTLMPIKSDDKRYYIKNNNAGIQLGFRFYL